MSSDGGFALSYGVAERVHAGEKDVVFVPRVPRGVGVVYCHGANGTYGQTVTTAKGIHELAQQLARSGFHVVDGDLGGLYTFGNDTVAARVEEARQVLIGLGCGPKVVLVGASMGNLSVMRYMADHPGRVVCGVGIIPLVDIDQVRDNDILGLRDEIETAWGIGASDPIPARGKPLGRVAEMTSVPWAGWCGSADTAVDVADCQAIAAALGADSQVVVYDAVLDHSDALLAAAPWDDIAAWILGRA